MQSLGLNFSFCVVEFYDLVDIGPLSQETNKANLLALEQKHLDWLFSLPESLRYNFNPTAGSILGYKHTEDTMAKMSGENHHMYGRTHTPEILVKISEAMSGANHPMYGRTHTPETLA
jgi:group I intron endonuclease